MLQSIISSTLRTHILSPSRQWTFTEQVRGAARKGTRIRRQMENRKRARQRALEAKLAPPKKWIPKYLKVKLDSSTMKVGGHLEMEHELMPRPPDNVYFAKDYYPIAYPFKEIIEMFRVTHDKTMLDQEDAVVCAVCEFDLRTPKKTKFVPPFDGLIHEFVHDLNLKQNRIILAICPDMKVQEKALLAGATIVGGNELIRELHKGRLKTDAFDELVVHSSLLLDMAPLRGILKKHFPTKSKGNYGSDIEELVRKFSNGISYEMKRDDFDPSYGWLEFPFARLNMSNEDIQENLEIGLNKIETDHRPKEQPPNASFIRKVSLRCRSESHEKLLLRHWELACFEGIYCDPYIAIEANKKEDEDLTRDKNPELGNMVRFSYNWKDPHGVMRRRKDYWKKDEATKLSERVTTKELTWKPVFEQWEEWKKE